MRSTPARSIPQAITLALLPLLLVAVGVVPAHADTGLTGACPDTSEVGEFPDTTGSVHAEAISCLAGWGITTGHDDGTFRPREAVTRGQLATFLHRLVGMSHQTLDTDGFNFVDVPDDHPHYEAIATLAGTGVVNGIDDRHFAPDRPVTRGQMAALLMRVHILVFDADLPMAAQTQLTDIEGTTHVTSIRHLVATGITTGYDDGTFRPSNSVTRDQMASFLARHLDVLVALDEVAAPDTDESSDTDE
jgi:hypothetical protein